jgi:SCY1-like protein 1
MYQLPAHRLEPHILDSYQLHLLLYILFNGPLPASFSSESSPALPRERGAIPLPLFTASRRLGAPAAASRLKVEAFHQQGMTPDTGFYSTNRLVRLAAGLDNFALASEGDRAILIKMVRDSNQALPADFMAYKVLPALVKAFEFGPGAR